LADWESFAIGPQTSVSVGGPDGSANFDGANYTIERLARFRRCCRFRSFHLAFWLLLSFARDALVHLNAIGFSLAPVSECPDPPSCEAQGGPGVGTTRVRNWRVSASCLRELYTKSELPPPGPDEIHSQTSQIRQGGDRVSARHAMRWP